MYILCKGRETYGIIYQGTNKWTWTHLSDDNDRLQPLMEEEIMHGKWITPTGCEILMKAKRFEDIVAKYFELFL